MSQRTSHEGALARVEFSAALPGRVAAPGARWLRGSSPLLDRLQRQVDALGAAGFMGVVIVGEPGTGRIELATWLHERSARSGRPLARLDASATDSVEAVRALSSAVRDGGHTSIPGNVIVEHVEQADDALIEACLELVTLTESAPSPVGLLLVTRVAVEQLRKRSLSVGQLLGRAASAMLRTPGLGERVEDIPELARDHARRVAAAHGISPRRLSDQALARLGRHDFAGNCRELEAIVELAVLRAAGDWVTEADLGLPQSTPAPAPDTAQVVIRMPGSSLRDIELQAIRVALQVTGGRLVRAAELLGITRHALRRKLEKYGLGDLRSRPSAEATPESLEEDSYI